MLAAPDAKEFYRRTAIAWLPELRAKYPKVEKAEGELLTPCEVRRMPEKLSLVISLTLEHF